MTGKEVYKIWAPAGSKWIDWVRPVAFIAINDRSQIHPTGSRIHPTGSLTIPGINYLSKVQENTAIILDLPGCDSIKEGIALAGLGYRPIPIYNGANEQQGAMALVNNHTIESALIWGAIELEKQEITSNAPPAFLLDSNRTHRFRMSVAMFDNSWDIYDQDMPSAEYFIENGINKIIVRGNTIQKDLYIILYKYQKKGIVIYFTHGYEEPKVTVIKQPAHRDK